MQINTSPFTPQFLKGENKRSNLQVENTYIYISKLQP